jgi:RNA polymerase sigma factor (sigma-70 family)
LTAFSLAKTQLFADWRRKTTVNGSMYTTTDLISALTRNDLKVKRDLFEQHYELMSSIALRFSKNEEQAKHLLVSAFDRTLNSYVNFKGANTPDFGEFLRTEFVVGAIEFIKSIRSEYYVASTVLANSERDKSYNLFESSEIIDYNSVEAPVLIKSLQELVPSQRLVFNLFVIDGIELLAISEMLEASEQTVKSNLEKARFNLQKNIDKNNRTVKHEQAL